MLRLGPYEFTDQDVSTTLAAGWALFDQLEHHLQPHQEALVAPHRAAAEAVLDRVLAGDVPEADALGFFWDQWRSSMATLRAAGVYGGPASGLVAGLFRSGGGVPKQPIEAAEVTWSGVPGDLQHDRLNHGRPFQALCLWSTEVIDAFRADGHPIAPGLAGENITLTGVPWPRVIPGTQLQIGDALVEISSYSVPCKKNAAWFVDGHFGLMHHRHGPVSRAYATVLEPGRVALGDAVLLEPHAP